MNKEEKTKKKEEKWLQEWSQKYYGQKCKKCGEHFAIFLKECPRCQYLKFLKERDY